MIKYTRTKINKNFILHDQQFITVDDMTEALIALAQAAVDAGADEGKMMETVKSQMNGGDDVKH
jgi:hypothetical protein